MYTVDWKEFLLLPFCRRKPKKMKRVMFAALAAVGGVAAFAQAPTLNYVKSINTVTIGGTNVLDGAQIAAVAAIDGNLYYAGFRTGSLGALNLVKVTGWDTASPVSSIIHTDSSAGQNGDTSIAVDLVNQTIWWATGLTIRGAVSPPGATEVYKLDYAGALKTAASGPLTDGIISIEELDPTNFNRNWSDMTVDPLSGRLAMVLQGSRAIRLFDNDNPVNPGLIGCPDPTVSTDLRALVFDPADGDLYFRARNDVFFGNRNATLGSSFVGYDNQTIRVDLTDSASNVQFINVGFVPSGSGYSPTVFYNDRPTSGGGVNSAFYADANTGTVFGSIDGSASGTAYTSPTFAFATDSHNGTQYIFIGGFKGVSQGVDVYQIGNAGMVSGTVNLNNVTAVAGKTINMEVRDDNGNVVDVKNVVLGAGGTYSFITTARGNNYAVAAKGSHWLRQAVTVNLGSSPVTANFGLINGDVNDDNEVGPADFTILSGAFGSMLGDPNYVAGADLNEDEEVGPADFTILSASFGNQGD